MSALQAPAKAAIIAQGVTRIYEIGGVPNSPAYPYLVLFTSADRATSYTLDASHGVMMHRVTTQSFGRTFTSASSADDGARAALLDRSLTVPGLDCGPGVMQVGAAVVRDPDPDTQGVIGITSTYLFATTKES